MNLVPMFKAHDSGRDGIHTINLPIEVELKGEHGDAGDRVISFVASTEDVDRDGDVILARGWDFKDFKRNPVILYGHNYHGLPVGRGIDRKVFVNDDNKTVIPVEFATAEMNPFADSVYRMAKAKFLTTGSVGFIWTKRSPRMEGEGEGQRQVGWTFEKQKLMEFSIVPVPSNPHVGQSKDVGHPYEIQEDPIFQAEAKGVISLAERVALMEVEKEDGHRKPKPPRKEEDSQTLTKDDLEWAGARLIRSLDGIVKTALEGMQADNVKLRDDLLAVKETLEEMTDKTPGAKPSENGSDDDPIVTVGVPPERTDITRHLIHAELETAKRALSSVGDGKKD